MVLSFFLQIIVTPVWDDDANKYFVEWDLRPETDFWIW
jgi:hypothetical protein